MLTIPDASAQIPSERPTFADIITFLNQFDDECSVEDEADDSLAMTQMTWKGDIQHEFNQYRQEHEVGVVVNVVSLGSSASTVIVVPQSMLHG